MTAANIEINGAASSNDNLPINTLVQLSNADTGGEVTYLWEILDQPEGAADALSSTVIENPTFTPKKEGTYLLRLTVNLGLGDEKVNTKIAAVRQVKSHERIPAAMETVEGDASKGWKTAANRLLQKVDARISNPNVVIAVTSSFDVAAVGDVVFFPESVAVIKSGLPGQESLPVVAKAYGNWRLPLKSPLGVVVGTPSGGAVGATTLVIVQRFGLVAAAEAGSPAVNDPVYVDNNAQPSLTPGSVNRVIGRVATSSAGSWTWVIDGSTGAYMGTVRNVFPNTIHNSGFWFAQRQVPGTLTTYSDTAGRALSADRWGITNANASAQYRRLATAVSTPETGLEASHYGEFTKITSTGKLIVSQVIEGISTARLRGKRVRLQFKTKRVGSGLTLRAALVQLTAAGTEDTIPGTFISAFGANTVDPTLGLNLAYLPPVGRIIEDNAGTTGATSQAYTLVNNANWVMRGASFDVPSDCKNLVVMFFTDSGIAAGVGFCLTEVSLTPDLEQHDWCPASIPEELSRCQRFYCKSFPESVAPAQNAGLAGALRGYVSVAGATANQPIGVRFPVQMRATPTMTFFSPSAATAFARNTSVGADATATALANGSPDSGDIMFTGVAGWLAGAAMAVHYTAVADL